MLHMCLNLGIFFAGLVSDNHQFLQNLTAAVQRVTAVPKRENVRELERHVDVSL